jgi:predicted ATPase
VKPEHPSPDRPALSPEQEARLDALCDRFEAAWKAGGRPGLEDYLAGTPDAERAAVAWDLLRVEAHYRRLAGEELRPAEYQERLPLLTPDEVMLALRPASTGTQPGAASTRREAPTAGSGEPDLSAPPGYELLGQLGRGGMGIVYKARDTRLHRPVALKFLSPQYTRDPEALWRFRREAQTASALNDPHICTVYALDEHQGQPYLALEFIDGQTFRALAGQARPLAALLPLVRQVARALSVAHAAGIVHRDIKPENLIVRPDRLVKVLDFGLARLLPASAVQALAQPSRATDPGTLIGTLRYMAPEQARGETVDAAADIFALGLVLYELVTGQHPFPADSEHGVLQAIVRDTPVPPARLNPEVPPGLGALIQRMLDKDPHRRPAAAEVAAALAAVPEEADRPGRTARRPTVGREQERATLRAGFESAAAGRGLLLCVTGEPGLGKTTLVEDFLDELLAHGQAHYLARGRCSERLAGAEAYLPMLEALDGLLRGADGALAASVMRREAPTWYVQLAPVAGADPALAALRAEVGGASQERLKRELGVFLGEVSRLRPLVLFLDDVHWADASTVDLLAYLGGRCAGLRLLVLLTYRLSELSLGRHPFAPVQLELQGRGVCREVALTLLGPAEVERYLALRFPGHDFPPDLSAFLHRHTEGNPLFLVDLLGYLCDQAVIVAADGRWTLARPVPDLPRELPDSIRGLIQRKLDRLDESDRRLLVAASVQGQQFDAAVVARALDRDAAEVEDQLQVLDRMHALVRCLGEYELPDRTATVRYGFVHALYQNALYGSLQPTRKACLSAAVARVLLSCHGEQSPAVAAELALLFEAARDWAGAAAYFLLAAQNAAGVFATQESRSLARRGLESLRKLPDTRARARQELQLQMTLGAALQATQGYASPEAGQACERARALCGQLSDDDGVPLFPVLFRLWLSYMVRADLEAARALAEQCLRLAHSVQDSGLVLEAHIQFGSTLTYLADYPLALEHCEKTSILFDPGQHAHHALIYGHDPLVHGRSFAAWVLWNLGYPAQARATVLAAVSRARELRHPMSLAGALFFAMLVHWLRREAPRVRELAETLIALAAEQGMANYRAAGVLWRGWALHEEGLRAEGVAQLRQGAAALQATGVLVYRTVTPAMLAEVLAHQGQVEEGLAALAEAFAVVRDGGEPYWEAELHRLQGELLLQGAEVEALARAEAEACFRQALAVARRQSAKALELRAVMSLSRLYQRQGRQAEARPLLAQTYGWFTEGFDTPDLREAKALLDDLA